MDEEDVSGVSVSSFVFVSRLMLTLALTRPAAVCPPDEGLTSLAETFLDGWPYSRRTTGGEDGGMAEVKVRQETRRDNILACRPVGNDNKHGACSETGAAVMVLPVSLSAFNHTSQITAADILSSVQHYALLLLFYICRALHNSY